MKGQFHYAWHAHTNVVQFFPAPLIKCINGDTLKTVVTKRELPFRYSVDHLFAKTTQWKFFFSPRISIIGNTDVQVDNAKYLLKKTFFSIENSC